MSEMDKLMGSLHDSSASVAAHAVVNVPTKEQLVATGDAATNQLAKDLLDQEMQELLRPDAASTLSQPGDASTQKYIYAPPRNVLIIPNIEDLKLNCLNESKWTKTLAPAPKTEINLTDIVRHKLIKPGITQANAKYPPSIPNFPIKFDRMMGYKEFLS